MANPAVSSSPCWRKRLAWLTAFWIGGVTAMALVTVLLRWVMRLVGLAS